MKFLDEVKLSITAGNGGSGVKHFRREKFVPLGGPDGGNGGRGGNVIFVGDSGKLTLIDFHYHPHLRGGIGGPGGGNNRSGKDGEDLIVRVPIGTEVYKIDPETEELFLLADIVEPEQEVVIARGGRGGKGNAFFKSATNQAPEHFQPGEAGIAFEAFLTLKLVAHVGLIGLPNAGKSTLISTISAARPKIADYPFTTLVPNLGVVRLKHGASFVVADIPGLIPGAHEGKGLGIQFLKHVERTSVLAHLIDIHAPTESGELADPVETFQLIQHELCCFSDELGNRPQIIGLTKADLGDSERVTTAKKDLEALGYPVFVFSSATQEGVEAFIEALSQRIIPIDPNCPT